MVVDDDDVGFGDFAAGFRDETVAGFVALRGGTGVGVGADAFPNLARGDEGEVGLASVAGFLRPLLDRFQGGFFGFVVEKGRFGEGPLETSGT